MTGELPLVMNVYLTQWGEMDVSRSVKKPAGCEPPSTTMHSLVELANGIGPGLERSKRVCPTVSKSKLADPVGTRPGGRRSSFGRFSNRSLDHSHRTLAANLQAIFQARGRRAFIRACDAEVVDK